MSGMIGIIAIFAMIAFIFRHGINNCIYFYSKQITAINRILRFIISTTIIAKISWGKWMQIFFLLNPALYILSADTHKWDQGNIGDGETKTTTPSGFNLGYP